LTQETGDSPSQEGWNKRVYPLFKLHSQSSPTQFVFGAYFL
jgi:hypothetical protein